MKIYIRVIFDNLLASASISRQSAVPAINCTLPDLLEYFELLEKYFDLGELCLDNLLNLDKAYLILAINIGMILTEFPCHSAKAIQALLALLFSFFVFRLHTERVSSDFGGEVLFDFS